MNLSSTAADLFVHDAGDGPAVVMIPGFGMDHTLWESAASLCTSIGHRALTIDQRGHGQSAKPDNGYDLETLAADVTACLHERGINQATVIGHSFGGQVAFAMAATSPKLVERLILVGSNGVRASRSPSFPFGPRPDAAVTAALTAERDNREWSREQSISSAFAHPPHPEVLARLLDISLQMPSPAAIGCYQTMFTADLTDRLDMIQQPTLQIIGRNDPVHSAAGARWLQEHLHASTLVEIENCGHFPMLEQPEQFQQALADFIST